MTQAEIESVCIFGSSARMSTDRLSDLDVLVVASDKYRRDRIIRNWRQQGWSVAVYSPPRLLKMIAAGSLFIQHLRTEGMVINDAGGWLAEKLSSARPKQSYAIDAQKSVFLARPMERLNGDTLIKEDLIAADLAYVATRNFGICYLADRNNLTFDYCQIVEQLAKDFCLSSDELSLLMLLRNGKTSYRNDLKCPEINGTVSELRDLLSKLFSENPLGDVDSSSPIRDLCTGYNTLRDFEAWMISNSKYDPSIDGVNGHMKFLRKWIYSPRSYSWDIRNISLGKLNLIKQTLEKKHAIHTKRQYSFGEGKQHL